MFKLAEPTMVLNAVDAVSRYEMTNTMDVPGSDVPEHFLGWAAQVADGFSGGKIKSLVVNCHGYYNGDTRASTGGFGLAIGTGIFRSNTGRFSVLKGKVDCIYITACGAARISSPDASGEGDGNVLCGEIAKAAGAYVYAGTTQQVSSRFPVYPRHFIADFDGLILRYTPTGSVDWTKDYGRGTYSGLRFGWN